MASSSDLSIFDYLIYMRDTISSQKIKGLIKVCLSIDYVTTDQSETVICKGIHVYEHITHTCLPSSWCDQWTEEWVVLCNLGVQWQGAEVRIVGHPWLDLPTLETVLLVQRLYLDLSLLHLNNNISLWTLISYLATPEKNTQNILCRQKLLIIMHIVIICKEKRFHKVFNN